MYHSKPSHKEELLAKWLNGELTDNELRTLIPEDTFLEFLRLKQSFDLLSAIHQSKKNIGKNLDAYIKQNSQRPKVKTLRLSSALVKTALGIAAGLLIFFVYYIFLNRSVMTYNTGVAQNIPLQLPDGSNVILKADSELKFDKNNWAANRKIFLEGEAYFEVTHGNKFDVETPLGTVSVLGTRFDVLAREQVFNVVCYEGKVKVVAGGGQKIILPQQGVQLINNKLQSFTTALNKPYWDANIATFKNQRLQDVLKDLARVYHLHFNIQNVDTDVKITGGFSVNDRDLALQSIFKPLDISYTIQSDTLVTLTKKY